MLISDSVRRNILSGFTGTSSTTGILHIMRPQINFDANNVFSKFIKVDISTDSFIVPMIGLRSCETIILNKHRSLSTDNFNFIDEIAIHLYANLEQVVRSGDSILAKFFNTNFASRLMKVKTSKGEIYYGGRGIIFDSQMNPLIMLALHGNIDGIDNTRKKIIYSKSICFVNPVVFTEETLMNKFIIKKLIPVITNDPIYVTSRRFIEYSNTANSKAIVIVENFDQFFVTPELSHLNSYSDEEANNTLIDFENELLNW